MFMAFIATQSDSAKNARTVRTSIECCLAAG